MGLRPIRKKNSHRQPPLGTQYLQHYNRKAIETAGSTSERLLPKSPHGTGVTSTAPSWIRVGTVRLTSSLSQRF